MNEHYIYNGQIHAGPGAYTPIDNLEWLLPKTTERSPQIEFAPDFVWRFLDEYRAKKQ